MVEMKSKGKKGKDYASAICDSLVSGMRFVWLVLALLIYMAYIFIVLIPIVPELHMFEAGMALIVMTMIIGATKDIKYFHAGLRAIRVYLLLGVLMATALVGFVVWGDITVDKTQMLLGLFIVVWCIERFIGWICTEWKSFELLSEVWDVK